MILYVLTAIVGLIIGALLTIYVVDRMVEREKEIKYGLPRGYYRDHRKM